MWLLERMNLFFQHRLHARSGFPGDVTKSLARLKILEWVAEKMILQVGPLVKGDPFFP